MSSFSGPRRARRAPMRRACRARMRRDPTRQVAARGIEVLVTVGELAAAMAEGFGGETYAASDAQAAAELMEAVLREGDTVLVKGSRGVGLERVAQALGAGESEASSPAAPRP